jgi:5-methyltetrahydrofolate--homocysteine methyltransferase
MDVERGGEMSTAQTTSFMDMLAERRMLIADGATGTNYQTMGMEPGLAPEEWLFQAPERVVELHRAFADAGADIILTCTFGATPLRLTEGPLAGRAREVNLRAAELAREGAGAGRLVAGSLGPTGQLIEPYGLLNREAATEAFGEQASALAEGGVDLLVVETIFAVEEAVWAVEGIQAVTDLPLVVSFSFDMGTRTMMGLSPTDAVAAVAPLGIAAVGTNCGRSLKDGDLVVAEILAQAGDLPVWVKPNAGVPKVVGAEVVYEAGPDMLAEHVAAYVEQGARIVGGCCGSTPAHVAAIARALGR